MKGIPHEMVAVGFRIDHPLAKTKMLNIETEDDQVKVPDFDSVVIRGDSFYLPDFHSSTGS
jgi:hypothetical protein